MAEQNGEDMPELGDLSNVLPQVLDEFEPISPGRIIFHNDLLEQNVVQRRILLHHPIANFSISLQHLLERNAFSFYVRQLKSGFSPFFSFYAMLFSFLSVDAIVC